MSLTREDVTYVANLARLEFSEDEVIALADQLGAVLDYAETLSGWTPLKLKPPNMCWRFRMSFGRMKSNPV